MNYAKVGNEIETNKDDNDIRRVKFALAKAAKKVLTENPVTENHAERAVLAKDIVQGNYPLIAFMYVIFTDSTIEGKPQFGGVSDAELQTAVEALYNVLAGIG